MAIDIMQPMRFTVDLAEGLVERPQRAHLSYGDKNANKIIVKIMDGGKDADLTGIGAAGMFYRPPNEDEVPLEGSVSGSEASVVLNEHCYTQEGQYRADVSLVVGEVTRTILTISGYVRKFGSGVLIDVSETLVNIDEVLAKLRELSAITDRATAAANRVEQMQINASGLAGDSNKLGGKAPEYYLTPVNLLDNSWFGGRYVNGVKEGLIYQAGLNGSHGSAKYPMDRWISWSADASFADGYITPASPIDQRIDLNKIDTSKTYTIAICLADGTIKCSSGTPTAAFGSYAVGIYAPAISGGVWYVRLANGINIRWAALYEGAYTADTLPPYVPKPYSVELAECHRYYVRWNADANMQFATGGSNSQSVYAPVRLAVPMRTKLASIEYSNVDIYPYTAGKSIAVTSLVIETAASSNDVFVLQANYATSADLGYKEPACVRVLAGGYIALSADL